MQTEIYLMKVWRPETDIMPFLSSEGWRSMSIYRYIKKQWTLPCILKMWSRDFRVIINIQSAPTSGTSPARWLSLSLWPTPEKISCNSHFGHYEWIIPFEKEKRKQLTHHYVYKEKKDFIDMGGMDEKDI